MSSVNQMCVWGGGGGGFGGDKQIGEPQYDRVISKSVL